jgi:hypothetical protein
MSSNFERRQTAAPSSGLVTPQQNESKVVVPVSVAPDEHFYQDVEDFVQEQRLERIYETYLAMVDYEEKCILYGVTV